MYVRLESLLHSFTVCKVLNCQVRTNLSASAERKILLVGIFYKVISLGLLVLASKVTPSEKQFWKLNKRRKHIPRARIHVFSPAFLLSFKALLRYPLKSFLEAMWPSTLGICSRDISLLITMVCAVNVHLPAWSNLRRHPEIPHPFGVR